MLVRMKKGREEPIPGGGRMIYAHGSVFNVDDDKGKAWIKEGVAVDEGGEVVRDQLLSVAEIEAERGPLEDMKQAQLLDLARVRGVTAPPNTSAERLAEKIREAEKAGES